MDASEEVTSAVRPAGAVRPPASATLWTVQVMRGAAALMVVIGHSQSAAGPIIAGSGGRFTRSTLIPWGAGVDLFFVISGFIMIHASGRLFGQPGARAAFLRRRLIRIVPLYWLVTTAFVALLGLATLKGGDPFPAARAILASYAFVPAQTWGDGRLFPVFDLGWTLNYEMFFYALLALVVAFPRGRAVATLGLLLALLVGVGLTIRGPSAAWFWTRPILLDFGLGVGVGALVARGTVLPSVVRVAAAIGGAALLLSDPGNLFDGPVGVTVANGWPRVGLAGLPVAVVLAAALLGREPPMPRAAVPFTRIGDASYSLYLLHPFALIAMEKLLQKLPAARAVPGGLLVAATVAVAIGIALVAYRRVERPMTAALAARLIPRATAVRSIPANRGES